jgi:hypothetical protein
MKSQLAFLIMLLSTNFANAASLRSYDIAGLCNRQKSSTASQIGQLQQIVQQAQAPVQNARTPNVSAQNTGFEKVGRNAVCSQYLNANGTVGNKGAHIVKIMTGQHKATYERVLLSDRAGDKPGMPLVCPRWKNLSKEQRLQFWVWTFAAISKKESTCGEDPKSKRAAIDTGTGELAAGEFQLNYALKQRNWRGVSSGLSHCRAKNILSFENNVACSLDIMVDQFTGVYSYGYVRRGKRRIRVHYPTGLTGNSYWAELKTNRTPSRMQTSPILADIKLFPPCR